MRIKKITIDSYGGLRNWSSPDMNDNLTVIYGPNESGKSTVTEFIRSTLFPSRASKYPVASKGDSGMIEVEMESGETKVLLREQKDVREGTGKLTVAEEFPSIDAETYRSLFGLDLDRLTDKKIISSNDFRNRFLTVPGGEKVPDLAEAIEKKLDSLMTKEKITDNKTVGRILKSIKEDDQRIAEIHRDIDRYDSLTEEKERLEKKVAEKRTAAQLILDVHAKKQVLKSQTANIERLNGLKTRRNDYERYRDVPTDSRNQYEILRGRIEELEPMVGDAADGRVDYAAIVQHRDEIERLWDLREDYSDDVDAVRRLDSNIEDYRNEISQMEKQVGYTVNTAKVVKTGQAVTERAEAEMKRQSSKTLTVLSALVIVAGVAVAVCGGLLQERSIPMIGAGAGVAAFGCLLLLLGIRKGNTPSRQWKEWVAMQGYPSNTTPERLYSLSMKLEKLLSLSQEMDQRIAQKNEAEQRISEYVNSVFSLFSELGQDVTNIEKDVAALHDLLSDAEDTARFGDDTVSELKDKRLQMAKFLGRYGGSEEAFLEACEGREELDRLDSEIRTLTESIETSTSMSINDLNAFFEDDESTMDESEFDTGELDRRIGEIDTQMRSIMENGEMDSLQQSKMNLENSLMEALREWAVYSVANALVKDACDHFYSDLQPDLIRDANRYLSMMTDGRYQLDSDPRQDEIAVIDSRMRKTANRWSTGLGDQVYLSLKMAMAKQMGTERMPLILDDVLVRFDDNRKLNTCRAIYEFSRDNQVILFTCEGNVRNFFNICGKHTSVNL